jgi:stage II sporulation protein AA (anti-sigma F factor antagonist)
MQRGVLIIRVEGELDMHTVDEFREYADNMVHNARAKFVLFNFKGVSFIDSSGLGAILGRYKKINQVEGELLVSQAQPQVAKIFEVSGLLQLIKLFETDNLALEYV